MPIVNAGVVQSIDANLVDLSSCWLWSTEDIWSQDYAQVLVQPISLEVNDLSELKFVAPITTLTIRRGTTTSSPFAWSGVVFTVPDPDPSNGGEVTVGTVTSVGLTTPDIFTVSGSPITTEGTLSFEFNNSPTNIVLGDGSVAPLSDLTYFAYYNSTSKIAATNTTSTINLVPGISTVYANTITPPNVINIKGSGTIKWHTLTNACVFSLIANSTNLAIIQLTGTRLLPAGITNRECTLDIDIDIVIIDSSTVVVSGDLEINDTYVSASTHINEEIALDTTTDVVISCNASWVQAQANNSLVISKLIVSPLYNPITITPVPPDLIHDGGYSYTVYSVPPLDGGTSSTVYSLPPINGGTA